MLTILEVADRLRCGQTKTKALIRAGAIPSVKIGGHRRVRETDLNAYIRELPVAVATG
jgi:excisionase family DNA binding protein